MNTGEKYYPHGRRRSLILLSLAPLSKIDVFWVEVYLKMPEAADAELNCAKKRTAQDDTLKYYEEIDRED